MLRRLNAALNDIPLSTKGIAVVSIPLLILVITLILTAWYERVSRDAQTRIRHSLQVKATIYEIAALMTASETGVRGYLLWKDPAYLAPYNQARSELNGTLTELADHVKNDTEQSSAAKELGVQANQTLNLLRDMLNNPRAASNPNSALTQRNLQSMKSVRDIITAMESNEGRLLTRRIFEYNRILEQINVSMVVLFLVALLTGLTASYVVSSSILKRVNELEYYARRVSRGQAAEWRDSGEDELGLLGRNIRIMTNTLLAREEALRQTRGQLEQANLNLEAQLQETRAANQELEAFSYSVSHDLRAPLRHIAGFSELILKNSESLDNKNLRYLNIISTSINQMGVLIDELLAFSRMGRTAINTGIVELNETISEVFTDFSPETAERKIDWRVSALPAVKGDKLMLRLVLQNLIGNAIKYTRDRDPAVIEIYNAPDPNDPAMTIITVKDNGVGFNMDYYDKLFGVFQRLHSSEEYEGTGIGLATVRRIVQRHGGQVYAAGEVGKGAEFSITLPVAPDKEQGET